MKNKVVKHSGCVAPAAMLVFSACWSEMSIAQSVPSQADTPGSGLQEIVVTAEKRETTVQSTPLSITALSGDTLQQLGVTSSLGIASVAPGISYRSSGPGQTEFEMRGLSSTGGSAPTVGFYLDEAPLTGTAGSLIGKVVVDQNLFDLDRVEVLRGPQGTLYGSGSMGGTIKLVTNAPKLDSFESTAEVNLASQDGGGFNRGGNLMLNFPLIDGRLGLRIVASDQYTDGWISRIVVNPWPAGTTGNCGYYVCTRGDVAAAPVVADYPRSNSSRTQEVRGSLLFQATDSATIRTTAVFEDLTSGGYSQYDSSPGTLAHYQPFDIAEPYTDRFKMFNADFNQRFDFATLTVTGAYFDRRQSNTADVSEEQENLLAAFFGYTQFLPATYTEIDETIQRSVEARMSSTGSGPFEWLAGAFASSFQSTNVTYTGNPQTADLSVGGAAANPLGIGFQTDDPYHVNQQSLFTEESYTWDSGLKLTTGLRWYRYQTKFSWEQSGLFSASGNGTQTFGANEAADSGFNPKVTLAYIPNPDLTTYATISKGFRPGGANQPLPVAECGPGHPSTYAPDSIWNYEIGEKARFFNDRLSVNGDLYFIKWKGIQQYLIVEPCGFAYSANAGDAEVYGPELEINAKLSAQLTLSLDGVYTKSLITSVDPAAQGFLIAANRPISAGTAVQNVPLYTASGTLEYRRPAFENYELVTRLIDSLVGPSWDEAYFYQQLPGYNILNFRLGLTNHQLDAFFVVNNVADKHAALTVNTTSFAIQVPELSRVSTNPPRSIGIDVMYKF